MIVEVVGVVEVRMRGSNTELQSCSLSLRSLLRKLQLERILGTRLHGVYNRRIFVCNICLISISDTASDGATKTLVLNIERAQHG